MEIFNEKIQYENPFMCMKIFESISHTERQGKWHYHKELEILVMLEGNLEIYLENELFLMKKGDVLLIGSSELHRDRTFKTGGLHYIVFQFDLHNYFEQSTMSYYSFFSESAFPLSRLNYIFRENYAARQAIWECVQDILEESRNKTEGYEIAVSMLIKKIILSLIRSDSRKLLQHRDNAGIIRLKPVLAYIEQHIAEKIHVQEASRVANISYYYFVKYFKKVLGMSFLEYVNYKKIKLAERILMTDDISVAQVGELIGMPNMAHFYKVFKKHNQCSPNEYRKKMLLWSQ